MGGAGSVFDRMSDVTLADVHDRRTLVKRMYCYVRKVVDQGTEQYDARLPILRVRAFGETRDQALCEVMNCLRDMLDMNDGDSAVLGLRSSRGARQAFWWRVLSTVPWLTGVQRVGLDLEIVLDG